jgi:NADPH2:quinone reductase
MPGAPSPCRPASARRRRPASPWHTGRRSTRSRTAPASRPERRCSSSAPAAASASRPSSWKLLGARVLAASSAPKPEACRAAGADEVVDYTADGWRDEVKRLAGPRGLDVVYDAVGGAWAEAAMRLVGWGGRYLVVGFAGGEIPRPPLNVPLLKGFSLVGVYWGEFLKRDPAAARAALQKLLGWLAAGRLRPRPPARYPLERAADALRDLEARRIAGKAVLVAR